MYFDVWNVSVPASCSPSVRVNSREQLALLRSSSFSLRLVLLDDGLRRQRVLVVLGVEEHAGRARSSPWSGIGSYLWSWQRAQPTVRPSSAAAHGVDAVVRARRRGVISTAPLS